MDHLISVEDHSMVETYSNEIVNEVIEAFGKESPSELELIATALYVYLRINDKDRIKSGVKKLKGSKYSDSRIDAAITKLIDHGYIAA